MSVQVAQERRFAVRRRARVARRWPPVGVCVAFAVAGVMVVLAVAGPWLSPQDPNQIDVAHTFAGPSGAHPFGTDELGRDLLSRILAGSRVALLPPVAATLVAGAVGTVLAVTAAWRGGLVDTLVGRLCDVIFAFPGILLALLAVTVLGAGVVPAAAAVTVAMAAYDARILRGAALRERSLPYVEALTIQGLAPVRIVVRHIVPNLAALVLTQLVIGFAFATIALSALSYLGLGAQPPQADWGSMVAGGQPDLVQGHGGQLLCASGMIVLAVGCATVIGDWYGDRTRVR